MIEKFGMNGFHFRTKNDLVETGQGLIISQYRNHSQCLSVLAMNPHDGAVYVVHQPRTTKACIECS